MSNRSISSTGGDFCGNSPLVRVLSRLEQVTQNATGYMACCPAHDDTNPSLSISEDVNRDVALNCFAGCDTQAVLDEIGLSFSDLYYDATNRPRQPKVIKRRPATERKPTGIAYPSAEAAIQALEHRHGPCVMRWCYQNSDDVLVGMVLRWDTAEGKDFRPVSLHDGKWFVAAMAEPQPLYRLPYIKDQDIVYVTEGEKACDALWRIDVPATTSAGGSNAADKTDWRPLAGKAVYILPDNDSAGEKYASAVANLLIKLSPPATVTMVRLPGLPEKGDVYDWIEAHDALDAEQMRAALAEIAKSAAPVIAGSHSVDSVDNVYASEEWPGLIPLGSDPVADFLVDTIPEPARTYLQQLAEFTQVPPDMPCGMFLAAVAIAVQKKFQIEPFRGWKEPLSLYVMVVMEPANRKSQVVSRMAAPIRKFEADLAISLGPEIRASRTEFEVRSKQKARLIDEIAKAVAGPDRDALAHELQQLDEAIAGNPVRSDPRLLVDDITPEHLGTQMARNGGRMGVLTPEGDLFEILAGRYSSSPNFGLFLKAHCGDEVRVDRGNRPSELIRHPSLSIGCCVQPEVLRGLHNRKEFRGKGMLARMLYHIPLSLLGRRKISPAEIDPRSELAYAELMQRLLDIEAGREDDGEFIPETLTLSPGAADLFLEFRTEIEQQLGEFGSLATIKDWGGKLPGAVARIAGLLHVVESSGCPSFPLVVSESTISNAIWIGRYYITHATAAFQIMGKDACMVLAEHIANTLQRLGVETVTKRDIHQHVRRHVEKPDDLDAPLNMLVDHNFIREVPQEIKSKGRAKSPAFEVSPHLLNRKL